MAEPIFSVIITAYNYAHYLPRALDSVLAQGFSQSEIIIIDDGSTDNTADICQTYCFRHPGRVFYHYQKNQGTSAARNQGIEKARGAYVIFLDADDEFLPGAMNNWYITSLANPQADFLLGGYISLLPDGKRKPKLPKTLGKNPTRDFADYMRQRFSISNGAGAIKRRVFEKIKFEACLPTMFDEVFYSQILLQFNCLSMTTHQAIIHRHDDSYRHNVEYVMNTQTAPMERLFSSEFLPTRFAKRFQREFKSRCLLSTFRVNYLSYNNETAKKFYQQAIQAYPKHLFLLSYLRKYLRIVLGMRKSQSA